MSDYSDDLGYLQLRVIDVYKDKELRNVVKRLFRNWTLQSKIWPGKESYDMKPKKVRMTLDYPLNKPWTKIVTINDIGDILIEAADFYGEIYAVDTLFGGNKRICDVNEDSQMVNKITGPQVWGHVMGDLNFEAIHFRKAGKRQIKDFAGTVSFAIGS